MNNCPHCGESLPRLTDEYCTHCRQPLDGPVRHEPIIRHERPAPTAGGGGQTWPVIVLVIIAIKVAVCFFSMMARS
jgi:hypothetical protein